MLAVHGAVNILISKIMIYPTELRIGNLISPIGDNDLFSNEFEFITKGVIEVLPKSFPILYLFANHFAPIPTTEDWLVKFGFEKGYDTKLPWSISFHMPNKSSEDEVIFMPDDDGNWFLSNTGGEGDVIQFIGKPFKYVHQLQNLYFALTGEELIIKPL